MLILAFFAALAGLVVASAWVSGRRASRRVLRDLPASNQDWVWY